MNRPLTIRQFISFHKLSVVALSSDYLAALKVREHDARQGRLGAFAGVCTPRPSGKFNSKRRNRQPLGYYTQVRDSRHMSPTERFKAVLLHAIQRRDHPLPETSVELPAVS